MSFLENLLALSLEAAPWLVFGLLLGGMMKALLPERFLHKHLKGEGTGSIIKAAVLGAPLPLCSCGVIPAALGLRKAGASKPATVSFLVSTPETGIDSVSITYALMGPFMAIVRPVAALLSAFSAGILVALFDKPSSKAESVTQHDHDNVVSACCSSEKIEPDSSGCCSSEESEPEPAVCCTSKKNRDADTSESSCCNSKQEFQVSSSFIQNAKAGIKYSFTDLLDNILTWLVIGIVFAALVKTFVPADFLTQFGSGLPAMLVMLLVGIPMYICATASTPLAAGLMLAGVSPGVVLVLLLAGPATNIATLGVISREMGKRTMMLYLAGTCFVALLAGLTVDTLTSKMHLDIQAQLHAGHDQLPIILQWAGLVALLFFGFKSIWRKYLGRD
jgi:uncharacterized membrane protein YraQ (UPF0718 family)